MSQRRDHTSRLCARVPNSISRRAASKRFLFRLVMPKSNQLTIWALEPITDKMFSGHWLERSKKSRAAESLACFVSNNSQWVTSRRKCRQSISMGLSQGLYVGR